MKHTGTGNRDEGLIKSLLPLRWITSAIFMLSIIFVIFFNLTKHDPELSRVNPFAEDPYDAVGSFGFQLSVLCAILGLIRAFCPNPGNESLLQRYDLTIRAAVLSILAVMVTIIADMTAMIHNPTIWVGVPGGRIIIALVGGLFFLALVLCLLVLGHAKRRGLFSEHQQSWRLNIAMFLASFFLLGLYPQNWRLGIPGTLMTAAAGMVFLFLVVAVLAKAIFPKTTQPGNDLLDDLSMIFKWLKNHLGFAALPLIWMEKIFNTNLIRTIIAPFNPRKHEWRLLVLVAVLMGIIVALIEAFGEGLPPGLHKALFVVTVFVTLEAAGVLLGYILFSRFLGIFRKES